MARITVDELAGSWIAVIVGCGSFGTTGFNSLPSPARDARRIASALIDPQGPGLHANQVTVLVDEAATTEAMRTTLQGAAKADRRSRRLLLYFAGHGVETSSDFHLIGHDTDPTDPEHTAVSGRELADLLAQGNYTGALVVLDCCVSAGFAKHAPGFFRELAAGAEFRILLSSSRDDQMSWERADGGGTVFTSQLISVLRGEVAAGDQPGKITFAGLLDAVAVGMEEAAASLPGAAAEQEPVSIVAYPRDPLLFVHRASLISGMTIETSRVTKAHLRRVIRRFFLATAATALFFVGTYAAFLAKHEYAETQNGRVVVLQGYPGLNALGYPHQLFETDIDIAELSETSPLRNHGYLIGQMGATIEPMLDQHLRPEVLAGRYVAADRSEDARRIVMGLLGGLQPGAALTETSLYASLLLPETSTPEDRPIVDLLLSAPQLESRTAAVEALLKLNTEDALRMLAEDAVARRRFEHENVLQAIRGCSPQVTSYLSRLFDAEDAHNLAGRVLDTAIRLRCPLSNSALVRAIQVVPLNELRYVGLAYRLLGSGPKDPEIRERETDRESFRLRAAVTNLWSGNTICVRPRPFAGHELPNRLRWAAVDSVCGLNHGEMAWTSADRLSIQLQGERDELRIEFNAAELNQTGAVGALLDLVEHVQLPTAPGFLRELVQSDLVDSTFKHDVIELLVRVGVPYDVSKPVPYGNSVYLRRAVAWWRAASDKRGPLEELLGKLNDGDRWDIPEVSSRMTLTKEDLSSLVKLAGRDGQESARAAALIAMHGTHDQIINLLRLRRRLISEAVLDYIGFRNDLDEFASRASRDAGAYRHDIQRRLQQQTELSTEFANVPSDALRTRGELLLKFRGTRNSSPRQFLSPGIVLWLREKYGIGGQAALD
jgi:hypothetical protein